TGGAGRSWRGVGAWALNFSLESPPLTLAVTDGQLQLNSAAGVGASKLNWATLTAASDPSTDPAAHHGLPFGLNIGPALSLHVQGNAAITFTGLLTVSGSFALDQLDVTDDLLKAQVGAGATAVALTLTAAGAGGGGGVLGQLG